MSGGESVDRLRQAAARPLVTNDDVSVALCTLEQDARETRTHELKVWPPFFQAILDGTKTFEVRFNDRDYRAGDALDLREYSPETGPTGRSVERVVRYVLLADDAPDFGLEPGFCVMSLADTALLPSPPATTGAGGGSYATCPKPCSNPIEHARYCLPAPAVPSPPATDGDAAARASKCGYAAGLKAAMVIANAARPARDTLLTFDGGRVRVRGLPAAPAETCGCPVNEAGDIRCHHCRERVNVKCWNCGTWRGEGTCPSPAAPPVDATETGTPGPAAGGGGDE